MKTPLLPIAGEQTLTVDNTAGGVTLTVPSGARYAIMTLLDTSGTVRWLDNGAAPTSSKGHQLFPGDVLDFTAGDRMYGDVLPHLHFIREGSTNGTLEVTYYSN